MTIDLQLPKLVLSGEPVEVLRQILIDRVREASNNTLTDFRSGSPLAALIEGQVFALAELQYYLNLLPEATAIELFRLFGVQRGLGTRARGSLRFALSKVSSVPFTLPRGYTIPYKDTFLVLTEDLYISAGGLTSSVAVECVIEGSLYNALDYEVVIPNPGLANLESIYNPEPLTGGSNPETIAETINRGRKTIGSRDVLITPSDYERRAVELLGQGSRAITIPKLSSDKTSLVFGDCAVFLLDAQGSPANTATLQTVKADLQERVFIGSNVWCFSVELLQISLEVSCKVRELTDVTGAELARSLRAYLDPLVFKGNSIERNELMYLIRSNPLCSSVDNVSINGQPLDYIMPQRWVLPKLENISIDMVNTLGQTLQYYRTYGEGDLD